MEGWREAQEAPGAVKCRREEGDMGSGGREESCPQQAHPEGRPPKEGTEWHAGRQRCPPCTSFLKIHLGRINEDIIIG